MNLNMVDSETQLLAPYLPGAIGFIESAVEMEEHVLVHSEAGNSRCVSIVLAYIMKTQNISLA